MAVASGRGGGGQLFPLPPAPPTFGELYCRYGVVFLQNHHLDQVRTWNGFRKWHFWACKLKKILGTFPFPFPQIPLSDSPLRRSFRLPPHTQISSYGHGGGDLRTDTFPGATVACVSVDKSRTLHFPVFFFPIDRHTCPATYPFCACLKFLDFFLVPLFLLLLQCADLCRDLLLFLFVSFRYGMLHRLDFCCPVQNKTFMSDGQGSIGFPNQFRPYKGQTRRWIEFNNISIS